MKLVAIASLFFIAASAGAVSRRQDAPQLNFEELFINNCAGDIYDKCPKEAEALQPYITGDKKDIDVSQLLEIASQVAKNKDCKASLRNCAGEIVKQAIIQLLTENPADA
ncbi:hypothetical protein NLG97_g6130 [Lecanicillium saksenae]|uniref:Uncharacterized protein n=1 Tax=Lecanicillium saksenae TaxID=468837 RepID=A0ACC1QR24_9HYPO|nr:hypothetical protein NLG97_g6130 [Lecanicillium saksenae]